MAKTGRNSLCPCGSGRKYKHCCLRSDCAPPASDAQGIASKALALAVARKHLEAGRPREAESLYQRVLAVDPDSADALNGLGAIACQSGRSAEGQAHLAAAIALDPMNARYHTNLGVAHLSAGNLPAAYSSLRTALSIDPALPEANMNLGTVLFNRGEADRAIAHFRQAARAMPRSADAQNNLGLALFHTGAWNEALQCYRKALALDAHHVLALMNLGNALRQQGRLLDAIRCYRNAVAANPAFAQAHRNLGKGLSDFGQIEEAAAAYRTAVQLEPAAADSYNSLGLALWELGRRTDAFESFQTAIRLRPDLTRAYFNLHTVHLSRRELPEAIRCLGKVAELAPEDLEGKFHLGMLLDYNGAAAAAAPLFEEAAGGPPWVLASLDSYRYIKSVGGPPPDLIGTPLDAFEVGLNAASGDGLVLEFGVRFGTSIRQIAGVFSGQVHGFDSFEGLPEAWHDEPQGSYTTMGAVPAVPANVQLHCGWFEHSIPEFLHSHPGPVRFMHIDCDLYSSTRTVLDLFASRIVRGTVIVFDEYLGHEHWREDEFRAFQDVVATAGWRYQYLAFSICTRQVVLRIL